MRGRRLKSKGIRILQIIRDHNAKYGYSPTYRKIAEQAGIRSVSNVFYWTSLCESMGYLENRHYYINGIKLTDAGYDLLLDNELEKT